MTATLPPLPARRQAASVDAAEPRAARGAERLARLASRTAPLGGRRTGGLPAERWLPLAGAVAMPTGVLLILFGWYGSAQTALPFEQTPYLISGGLLGLAFVITGGFLYFAQWSTLQVREARTERAATQAHQERVEDLLRALVAGGAPAPALSLLRLDDDLDLEEPPAPPRRRAARPAPRSDVSTPRRAPVRRRSVDD